MGEMNWWINGVSHVLRRLGSSSGDDSQLALELEQANNRISDLEAENGRFRTALETISREFHMSLDELLREAEKGGASSLSGASQRSATNASHRTSTNQEASTEEETVVSPSDNAASQASEDASSPPSAPADASPSLDEGKQEKPEEKKQEENAASPVVQRDEVGEEQAEKKDESEES